MLFALSGYSCASGDGWRGGAGPKTTYRNQSNRFGLDQGCAEGSAGGLRKLEFRDRRLARSRIEVKVDARGPYGSPTGPLEVAIATGFSVVHSSAGNCGTVTFLPGDCQVSGRKVVCAKP